MKTVHVAGLTALIFSAGTIAVGFAMDAAIDSVLKDCTQLGGFRHEDKVYVCTRIRPQPLREPTHEVPLTPDLPDSGEGSEEGEQR